MKNKNLPLLCLITAACPIFTFAQHHTNTPNVIVIMADDIGYGDLSCNGENTIKTPNVDKLAAEGIRFTNAHAVAATSTPSRYSFLTGEYAWRREDTGIAAGNAGMIIRPEQYTVGKLFQSCGYSTAVIGKWHLGLGDKTGTQNWNGFISPGPSDIGFESSFIMAATADRVPCVWVENQRIINLDPADPIEVSYEAAFPGEPLGSSHPELLTKQLPSPNHEHDQTIVNGISRIGYMKGGKSALWTDEYIGDSITLHAISYLEQHQEKPFFLYLATNDIHVPRAPHPRFTGKSRMGPRGDAILQFDWTVGQVIETLDRLGIRDNTLIILTSDNGPVVDDGYQDQAVELLGQHRPWGDFRGGKYSSFEAGTRVPFIVSWPTYMKKGVSHALISQVDFLGSMASMLKINIPEGLQDSYNELNAWMGLDKKGRDYVILQAGSLSVYDGTWKYIAPNNGGPYNALTRTETGNSSQHQLYNLKKDKGEKNNLAEKYPEIVQRLAEVLKSEQ